MEKDNGDKVPAHVLMVGPDLSLKGGIVTVVKGYMESGLAQRCESLDYLGTGVGSSTAGKAVAFACALAKYRRVVDGYDIVHLHISAKGSYKRKSIMARIAHKRGKAVILHDHDGEFAKTFEAADDAYREDVRRTFGIADRVIVLSEEWHEYFAANVCDESKLTVLHNAVSVPPKACTPCAHQDVLFLGRLDARKSADVLLRASRETLDAFPDAHLLFGGNGEIDRYKRIAEDLGIAERCEFAGWVTGDARERLFERAGIYCLPSKNEGMPMSVLEAMAHGIPTVATAVGGVPQIIDDGEDGFLMPVDDEAMLSELLQRLEGSPELRGRIGGAGREKIKSKFSLDEAVERLADVYRSVAKLEPGDFE